MKLVVQIRLLPTLEQAAALATTIHTANAAATWLAAQAQTISRRSRTELQRAYYSQVKAVGLASQPTLHVIRKVADAYTTRAAHLNAGNYGPKGSRRREQVENSPIRFRHDAAQPFDDRCLSWQYDARTVSIWTTAGRMKNVRYTGSADQLKSLRLYRQGETDLIPRNGMWFLYATCEVPELEIPEPVGWIGVDLGLANIATTSTGYRAAGRGLRRHRERHRQLRRKLQVKGTKAAKRVLKRQRRREFRHVTDINHRISKSIGPRHNAPNTASVSRI
ncbi:hypothetical protein ACFV4K_33505 [Nocardia sp. NPDC059764]|uniref:hypothetical protein n=1 Tax=Nocardia sp. NPDC059764 TaxID=3346939 RepID=UPI003658C86B